MYLYRDSSSLGSITLVIIHNCQRRPLRAWCLTLCKLVALPCITVAVRGSVLGNARVDVVRSALDVAGSRIRRLRRFAGARIRST